jgi:hypothetical protein
MSSVSFMPPTSANANKAVANVSYDKIHPKVAQVAGFATDCFASLATGGNFVATVAMEVTGARSMVERQVLDATADKTIRYTDGSKDLIRNQCVFGPKQVNSYNSSGSLTDQCHITGAIDTHTKYQNGKPISTTNTQHFRGFLGMKLGPSISITQTK